jgi:hypothetical protein
MVATLVLLILVLALVNAGVGGADRIGLVAVAVVATGLLWAITRRPEQSVPPGPPRGPAPSESSALRER